MEFEIKKLICALLSKYYPISEGCYDKRILMNSNVIQGIDLFYILYLICTEYNVKLSDLTPYNGDISINGLTEYILEQINQTKDKNTERKEGGKT